MLNYAAMIVAAETMDGIIAENQHAIKGADSLADKSQDTNSWERQQKYKSVPVWKLKKYQTANDFLADYPELKDSEFAMRLKMADLIGAGVPRKDIVRALWN